MPRALPSVPTSASRSNGTFCARMPSPDKPAGAAMAVLSTYGLDDARFADLNARWERWWAPRYASEDA